MFSIDCCGKSDIMALGGGEMVILPNADRAVISIEKLVNYALDVTHNTGMHKAFVFESVLGYTTENAARLTENIKNNVDKFPAVHKGSNLYGEKYEVIMQLVGANGRKAEVVTGWIIDNGSDTPRLVTAYII